MRSTRPEPPALDFRLLFNSAPGLYVVVTPDLRVVAASDAYLSASRTERDAMLGRDLFEVFPDSPDDLAGANSRNMRASLERVVRTRAADSMAVQRHSIRRSDAEGGGFEERYWSPIISPVFAADGAMAFMIVCVEDVTAFMHLKGHDQGLDIRDLRIEAAVIRRTLEIQEANRRAEGALRQREEQLRLERTWAEAARHATDERYRTLFENAPDGIVIADRESYYIDANPSICAMLGYSREELIGLHASDIVAATEIQHIGSALRVIMSASDYHREWQFRRKDGSLFCADVIATVMPDGNLLGMIRDVTERNEAVEALRTAEERMRFALENAEIGIWDMDYTTGVLRWSKIIEGHYGLRPGTFGGTFEAFVERVHPADRAAVVATFGQASKAGLEFSLQNRALWDDGTVRWLSGAGRVLMDEHGAPRRAVGISMDVSERHTLEGQYQQAQKMEAIGRLAGGVAHDFNNLLTVILGYCGLLVTDSKPGDPRLAAIVEIQQAGARASELTRQLLAFSRKQIIQPALLHLNQIMADLQVMLERLIGEDVKVVFRPEPALGLVKADRGQVEQILMNLAVNARDAMPAGGTLTIETANVELDEQYATTHVGVTPGPYVLLTVTDTGTGMTPEVQARLFEPFFTTKEPGKGTGLGMATVYGIVTGSGGSVSVSSEPGKGTAFQVYFPQVDDVELDAVVPASAASAASLTGTQTVLLVEDEDGVRLLARKLLERLGYTVLPAAGLAEAVRVFEDHPSIDLLLTDVVMPGGSGPELARQLIEQRPALNVIYMSGYTEDAIVKHGVLEPGVAFLNKPFTSQTLGQKIRDVLAH